ncbi:MAG: PAS domain S-box protein [Rhizomicrobium sp.]
MAHSGDQLFRYLDEMPDATLIVDAHRRITFASRRVKHLLGYAPADLLGTSIGSLTPERFRDASAQRLRKYLATPKDPDLGLIREFILVHRDGREFAAEVSVCLAGPEQDRHMIFAIRNISERKRQEDALRTATRELEQRATSSDQSAQLLDKQLRFFVRHVPAAVAMVDRQMRYIIVSRRWQEDYGLTAQNIVGRSHYELFPEIPERWREMHRRCLQGETLQSSEDSFVRADGTTEWLRWELRPWRNPTGDIGGIIMLTEVITQRKLAEQDLLTSRKKLEERVAERTLELETAKNEADRATALKSRFLAAASHDLRQPLQAASTYLSALGRVLEKSEHRDVCDKARQPLDAMAGILDVLLDISRLERGAIVPHWSDFRLDELAARIIASNRLQADAKGLRLVVGQSDCVAHSDPALLERVIDNLFSNAIRYTDLGEVSINCETEGDIVRISVRDSGIGIPARSLDDIFDEFVQLDNPARDRAKGLGLGLSIAKHISDILGHTLSVQSEVGRGSTFSIELRAGALGAPEQDASEVSVAPLASSSHRPVVLFVDDDPAVRDSMLLMLEIDKIEAHGAGSGDEALTLIASGLRPSIVVSDFRLPNYDGTELIARVRDALGRNLPALVMTGDTAIQELAGEAITNCTVLHKPVDYDRLSNLVKRLSR